VIGFVVEITVLGLLGNELIVILLGLAIIDSSAPAEAVDEIIYSSWHNRYGFGL